MKHLPSSIRPFVTQIFLSKALILKDMICVIMRAYLNVGGDLLLVLGSLRDVDGHISKQIINNKDFLV